MKSLCAAALLIVSAIPSVWPQTRTDKQSSGPQINEPKSLALYFHRGCRSSRDTVMRLWIYIVMLTGVLSRILMPPRWFERVFFDPDCGGICAR